MRLLTSADSHQIAEKSVRGLRQAATELTDRQLSQEIGFEHESVRGSAQPREQIV